MDTTIVRLVRATLGILSRLSPQLAARLLANRFLATKKRQPPAREQAWLHEARRFTVESRGKDLSAVCWGAEEAPAILLMHGWEGRASQMGAFAAPLLEAGFRVVALDAPGHGESPGRRSSILEMGQAVIDLAEAMGGVRAVIAHSGGSVAATFAVESGLKVESLVFISAPYDAGKFLYDAAEQLGLSHGVAARTQGILERRLGVHWHEFEMARLAKRRCESLLVIHDRSDRIVPLEDGEAIVQVWPKARLEITEGLGHHRILRNHEVTRIAAAWVAGSGMTDSGISVSCA
ncbi:MAG: alpha/beta hydrolase [Thermoanaerobaculia bacterium]|nr:alpha/beta hydrolase [Thermoanaerobaculia bacterium]